MHFFFRLFGVVFFHAVKVHYKERCNVLQSCLSVPRFIFAEKY